MTELLALSVFLIVLIAAGALTWLSVPSLLNLGLWGLASGLVVGVPAGVYYHVLLYRNLRQQQRLPQGWFWRPTTLHDLLAPADQRRQVLLWGYVGGAGFVVICAGAVPVAIALWKVFSGGPPA